jgi:hypothetical protein
MIEKWLILVYYVFFLILNKMAHMQIVSVSSCVVCFIGRWKQSLSDGPCAFIFVESNKNVPIFSVQALNCVKILLKLRCSKSVFPSLWAAVSFRQDVYCHGLENSRNFTASPASPSSPLLILLPFYYYYSLTIKILLIYTVFFDR